MMVKRQEQCGILRDRADASSAIHQTFLPLPSLPVITD
jgi:hypothetical protein